MKQGELGSFLTKGPMAGVDPSYSSRSKAWQCSHIPPPNVMGYLVGSSEGLGQPPLPSPPCPVPRLPRMVLPATSCGPFGISPVPRLCSKCRAGPPPCGKTTVVSAEAPAVFPDALVSLPPSSWVSALFVLILLPEDCFLQMLQH